MKTYVKPMLCFESFQLNQTIAACAWDMQQADKNSCVAHQDYYPGQDPNTSGHHSTDITLFTDSTRCTVTEEQKEQYCYTNGAEGMRVFQS